MLNSLQEIYQTAYKLTARTIELSLVVNHTGHKGLFKQRDTNYYVLINSKEFLIDWNIGKLLDTKLSKGKSTLFNIVIFTNKELLQLIIDMRNNKLSHVK